MSMKFHKFLLFGDSITEFAFNTRTDNEGEDTFALGPALVNIYTRKMDIIQRGFSGYNSRWGLKLLPHILENENDIVMSTIFFGSNDACISGSQHVPLNEYKDNIRRLAGMLKAKGIKPIIVGPALHDQEKWHKLAPEEVAAGRIRSSEKFKEYSDAAKEVAEDENIPFVDLHSAFNEKGRSSWRSLFTDGLHYSGKGYEVFFNELMSQIRMSYPELSPEKLPYKMPYWRDVLEDGSNLNL